MVHREDLIADSEELLGREDKRYINRCYRFVTFNLQIQVLTRLPVGHQYRYITNTLFKKDKASIKSAYLTTMSREKSTTAFFILSIASRLTLPIEPLSPDTMLQLELSWRSSFRLKGSTIPWATKQWLHKQVRIEWKLRYLLLTLFYIFLLVAIIECSRLW